MKNILRENMRRFGTKNLNEQANPLDQYTINGLVKQKQSDDTYFSLLHNDGKKRLFYIRAWPWPDEQYNVSVASVHQQFFPLVKDVFNLIKKIDTTEKYAGQDVYEQDTDIAHGNFQMDLETLNNVMKSLSTSVPSLLSKYKVEKIKEKIK